MVVIRAQAMIEFPLLVRVCEKTHRGEDQMRKALIMFVMMMIVFVAPDISNAQVKIIVDGKDIVTDTAPVIENGRTLVPLRAVSEGLHMGVKWNDATKTVTVSKDSYSIDLKPGSNTAVPRQLNSESNAYVAGAPIQLDVPAKIINGRMMVPLRFIAEAFSGYEISYNNGIVYLTTSLNETDKTNSSAFDYNGYFAEIESLQNKIEVYDKKYGAFARGISPTDRFVDADILEQAKIDWDSIFGDEEFYQRIEKYGEIPSELKEFNVYMINYFESYVFSIYCYLELGNNEEDYMDVIRTTYDNATGAERDYAEDKEAAIKELQKAAPQYSTILK